MAVRLCLHSDSGTVVELEQTTAHRLLELNVDTATLLAGRNPDQTAGQTALHKNSPRDQGFASGLSLPSTERRTSRPHYLTASVERLSSPTILLTLCKAALYSCCLV